MAFNIFTMLCNYNLYVAPIYFHHPKRKPCTHEAATFHSPPPSPWQPPICFLCLRIYLLWIFHGLSDLLCLLSFIWHDIFKVNSYCGLYQIFIPFYGEYSPLNVYAAFCLPFITDGQRFSAFWSLCVILL